MLKSPPEDENDIAEMIEDHSQSDAGYGPV